MCWYCCSRWFLYDWISASASSLACLILAVFSVCLCVQREEGREREVSGVFLLFGGTSSSRGKNQTTREKCLKKTRSRRTKTYLVSPRSRSRSPLVPPVKAFESRLVSANPFSLISLKSTFTLSLCLSLSVVLLLSKVFIYVLQKGKLLRRIVKITLLFSLSFRLVLWTRVVVLVLVLVTMMKRRGRILSFFGLM